MNSHNLLFITTMHLRLYELIMAVMHQSFVSTAPTNGDSRGIAGLKCRAITFLLSRSAGQVWGL